MRSTELLACLRQEYPLVLPAQPGCFRCTGVALADGAGARSANVYFGLPYGPPRADCLYFCCAPGTSALCCEVFYADPALTLALFCRVQQLLAPQLALQDSLAQLDRFCLSSSTLEEFTRQAGQLLGNPLLIVDPAMATLALWPMAPTGIDSWDSIYRCGHASSPIYLQMDAQMEQLTQTSAYTPCIVPYLEADGRQVRRLVAASHDPRTGRHYGGIALFEHNRTFTAEDLALAERLCQLLVQYLARPLSGETYMAQEERLLRDLLYLEPAKRENMARQLKRQKLLPEKGPWHLVCIPLSAARRKTSAHLRGLLAAEFPNSWSLATEAALILLLRTKNAPDQAQLQKQLADVGRRFGLFLILSDSFDTLLEISECWQFLSIAAQTPRCKNGLPGCARAIGLYTDTFLHTAAQGADLRPLIFPAIRRLAEYDQTHETALLCTLNLYLEEEGDLNRAAARLFIHRNTLAYRMQRIERIACFCLKDRNVRQAARLGCQLWDYYHPEAFRSTRTD